MVAVATNLAHDGLCSPVATLDHDARQGLLRRPIPLAVVVDLDFVRTAPARLVRSGIGDAVSNISAHRGLGARPPRAAASPSTASRSRSRAPRRRRCCTARTASADDDFLMVLAEALVLSGIAMSVAGTSRPCSGACHEIIHAVDVLFPGVVQPRRARRHRRAVRHLPAR